ncbi:MAG: stage II sporulation protein P [Peptococcaceae bacterium]|nr:stage II sporulation protein P [Peptococcaceae bacterium]
MKTKAKLGLLICGCLVTFGIILGSYTVHNRLPVWTPINFNRTFEDHLAGHVSTILDQEGNFISKTARTVVPGDEIITANGKHYKIISVNNEYAEAKLLGIDQELLGWYQYFDGEVAPAIKNFGANKSQVAIYHTHSDESYVPSDGSAAQPGKGGILKVGAAMAQSLMKQGLNVIHDKTPHEPHDAQAYMRSRKTATQLLKKNPVALFDVHRDGVPDADFYRRNIDGKEVTQCRLVIGRQNSKMKSNLDFAKRLMAAANKRHPNLVKEIFLGKGNYNQDLMSTALLIEVGTHTNSRERAQNGVALLADVVPSVLGAAGFQKGGGAQGWNTILWIAGIAIVGGLAFLVVSSGGLKQARERLRNFTGKELELGKVNQQDDSGQKDGEK